ADSLAARAGPPFRPPLRPSATAAGSFSGSSGLGFSSPIASPTIAAARAFRSRGLRERSGMDEMVALVLLSMIPIVVGAVHMLRPEATTRFYRRANKSAWPGIRYWNWPPDPRTARLMGLGYVILGLALLFSTFAF